MLDPADPFDGHFGIAVFWAGLCVSGTQVGANALSAAFYPTECRATGVSLSNGIGRCGSMLGALAGGSMLSMGLSMPTLFTLVGLPCLIAAVTMVAFGLSQRGRLAPRSVEILAH